jgi:hypothetical protein
VRSRLSSPAVCLLGGSRLAAKRRGAASAGASPGCAWLLVWPLACVGRGLRAVAWPGPE